MNKLLLIPILIGIMAIVIFSIVSISSEFILEPTPSVASGINFNYSDVENIQKILATQNISMSSPVAITDYTVDQYCTFFDDDNVQKFVKYCTTTALVGSDGQQLGNINMGGSSNEPIMALALIEIPFLNSTYGDTDFVFQTLIETLVCDCWEEQRPGGFESVSAWLVAAEKRYDETAQTTIKSKINGLAQKQLILEITATEKSYLWTLIILK